MREIKSRYRVGDRVVTPVYPGAVCVISEIEPTLGGYVVLLTSSGEEVLLGDQQIDGRWVPVDPENIELLMSREVKPIEIPDEYVVTDNHLRQRYRDGRVFTLPEESGYCDVDALGNIRWFESNFPPPDAFGTPARLRGAWEPR